jgi:hypothetical protein
LQIVIRKRKGHENVRIVQEEPKSFLVIAYHDMYRDKDETVDHVLARKQFVRLQPLKS